MNNSSLKSFNTLDLSSEGIYIGFGLAAIVTNLIVIFVLARNFSLVKKSAFMCGLAIADIINGLALFATGILRIQYATSGKSRQMVHPFTCLQSVTTLWLIGVQLPTVVMVLIGAERVIAIACFMWYYQKWTNVLAWILTCLVYALCALSLSSIWAITYHLPFNATTSINCITPSVVGPVYSSYNYGLPIICGTIAALLSITALTMFLVKKKKFQMNETFKLRRHVKKQWQLTTSMACIAVVDFGCVVIPNIFLLLIGFSVRFPPGFGNVGNWSASVFCARSATTLFIYLICNREFRIAIFKAFGFHKVTIHPNQSNDVENKTSATQF